MFTRRILDFDKSIKIVWIHFREKLIMFGKMKMQRGLM